MNALLAVAQVTARLRFAGLGFRVEQHLQTVGAAAGGVLYLVVVDHGFEQAGDQARADQRVRHVQLAGVPLDVGAGAILAVLAEEKTGLERFRRQAGGGVFERELIVERLHLTEIEGAMTLQPLLPGKAVGDARGFIEREELQLGLGSG